MSLPQIYTDYIGWRDRTLSATAQKEAPATPPTDAQLMAGIVRQDFIAYVRARRAGLTNVPKPPEGAPLNEHKIASPDQG